MACCREYFIQYYWIYSKIESFSHSQTQLLLNEQVREDATTSPKITRIFHNKFINYAQTIAENYSQYITANYLFFNGGYPLRERIPNMGLLYIWELPFLLIGLYIIIKRKNMYGIIYIILWLLLLLPAAITFDEIPNVYRTLIVLPFILPVSAMGLVTLFSMGTQRVKYLCETILIFIGMYTFGYFIHQYFVHQDIHNPWYRGYAYKALIKDLEKYYPKYKKIVITKAHASPYIYLLFYEKYDPKKYQTAGSPRELDNSGFDKYIFVANDCPISVNANTIVQKKVERHTVYVDEGTCPTSNNSVKVLDRIKWEYNTSAFKLLEYTGSSYQ